MYPYTQMHQEPGAVQQVTGKSRFQLEWRERESWGMAPSSKGAPLHSTGMFAVGKTEVRYEGAVLL